MSLKSLWILLFLAVVPSLSLSVQPAWAVADIQSTKTVKVTKVVDGDTLVVSQKKKIRLIGVDTPEVHEGEKLRHDAEQTGMKNKEIRRLGMKSAHITERLVDGKRVRLESDQDKMDRYGRRLAYVYFTMNESEFFEIVGVPFVAGRPPVEKEYMLNRVLVEYGYAKAYTKAHFRYRSEFIELERVAQARGLGIWARAPGSGK